MNKLFISRSNSKNDRHFFGMVQKKDDQNEKNKIFLMFQKVQNLKLTNYFFHIPNRKMIGIFLGWSKKRTIKMYKIRFF
jgi:hypothetical protein